MGGGPEDVQVRSKSWCRPRRLVSGGGAALLFWCRERLLQGRRRWCGLRCVGRCGHELARFG